MTEKLGFNKIESPETIAFQGTLSFDIGFVIENGEKKVKLFEINGEESGIQGAIEIEKDPKIQEILKIRMEENPASQAQFKAKFMIMHNLVKTGINASREGEHMIYNYA